MKNYFKNKGIGFYFVLVDIVLAVALAIVFFATYKLGNGNGQLNMANNAYASVPEVIGIFMIVGAVVDLAALVLPEYLPIHYGALICYGISLIKIVFTIPDVIVGKINGIAYEGGNFELNLTWLIIALVILGLGIAVCFVGLLNDKAEEEKLLKEKPGLPKLIKAGSCALLVVAAVVGGIVSSNVIKAEAAKGQKQGEEEEEEDHTLDPFKEKLAAYDFDPSACVFSEESNPYHGQSNSAIQSAVGSNLNTRTKDGVELHKVYVFEGSTAEGWQGDYSLKKGYLTLWEDGLYNGTSNGNNIYGYWYNRDAFGEECLALIATDGNNMVCNKLAGASSYYEWSVDMKASYNGGRLIKVNGLKYYPLVDMYIDTAGETLEYEVGSTIDMGKWAAMQVRGAIIGEGEEAKQIIKAGSIFDAEHEVKYTMPDMSTAGEKEITATWSAQKLSTTVKITVKEATVVE